MRALVIFLLILLIILHQDFWWWDDADPLIFGFIPIGLAWHVGISLAAAVVWFLAVTYCWPAGLDGQGEVGSTSEDNADGGTLT